jgi:hypothetical protein
MDKNTMLDTIDSLIACIRGNEQDIDILVEVQLEGMPNDELEAYFRNNQTTYYRSNLEDFKDDYQWQFLDG